MRRFILLFIAGAVTAAVRPIVAQPSESGSTTSGHRIAITICGAFWAYVFPKNVGRAEVEGHCRRPSTTALALKGIST